MALSEKNTQPNSEFMKKIVIAVDSFKGCLSSSDVNNAVEEGVWSVYPTCQLVKVAVADGGEGMLDVLVSAWKGAYITVRVHDPLMNLIECRYGISGDGQTALIEMAQASGLPLVLQDRRNPMLTSTFGTGELIRDALNRGCRNFIIGIGGSATNDGGVGMLQALGYRFLNADGLSVGYGGQVLSEINSIDSALAHPAIKEARFTVACDVDNPFYGTNGAAYVYGPQKGATEVMIEQLDSGLRSLAGVIIKELGIDIANVPGAGAAGGMGGGLLAFLHAELTPGIKLLLDSLDFEQIIEQADLIITGEGRLDRQTLMGKVPKGILDVASRKGIPVIAIAGSIEDIDVLNDAGFAGVFAISPGPVLLEQSMEPTFAVTNIKRTIEQVLSTLRQFDFS